MIFVDEKIRVLRYGRRRKLVTYLVQDGNRSNHNTRYVSEMTE